MLEIPGEPKAWGRAGVRVVKLPDGRAFARHYTKEHTASAESYVKLIAGQKMEGRALFAGPLRLDLTLYMPIRPSWSKKRQERCRRNLERPTGKPDADNFAKLYGDALNKIVWVDDSQVVELSVKKFYSDRPRALLAVAEIATEALAYGAVPTVGYQNS